MTAEVTGFLDLGLVAIGAVLVMMLLVNVASHQMPQLYLFWCLGGSVVVLAIGLLDGATLGDLGLAPSTWPAGLIWSAVLIGIVLVVYAVGFAWRRTQRAFADRRIAAMSTRRAIWNALVELPFGTVLFEEVAFRGVLYAMLVSRSGVPWAIAWCSILFGLWHILPSLGSHESNAALGNVAGQGRRGNVVAVGLSVLGTGAFGVVFCLLRQLIGSLFPPMALHWALNGWGYVFARHASRRQQ
ncbi:MAG: CPBP family intramembrane metalloprotease [Actinomycetota bacterium]|nr:MAG: CPBP family intramembrane metalloprotease [Actinomycetota bacterium]